MEPTYEDVGALNNEFGTNHAGSTKASSAPKLSTPTMDKVNKPAASLQSAKKGGISLLLSGAHAKALQVKTWLQHGDGTL